MKLLIDVKHPNDLWLLMEYLRSFKDVTVMMPTDSAVVPSAHTEKLPLKEFIGAIPELDVAAFEKYLEETRSEWERNIF